MALETGDFIPDLNQNNPLGSDPKSEGDDHIRLVKRCTQGSFPAFVGSTAVPKSVSLTEDEISDAGLQNRANTWALLNTFNTQIRLSNNVALSSRNQALTAEIPLVRLDTTDIATFGDAAAIRSIFPFADLAQFFRSTDLVLQLTQVALGSVLVVDRADVPVVAGFRGARPFDISGGLTLRQDHEDNTIFATGAAQGFTAPQLLTGTTIRIVTEFSASGTEINAGAGVTIRTHQGGSQFGGDVAIAPSSVCEIVWRSATEVRVWGNGLTPA